MVVLYTAEIELRLVMGGTIRRKYDAETGTGFWNFAELQEKEYSFFKKGKIWE